MARRVHLPRMPRFRRRAQRRERRRLAAVLRTEAMGGALLVVVAIAALAIANSPWAGLYQAVRNARIGPAAWGFDLTIAEWTADGLLVLFFFLAGLELKSEFVAGNLRGMRQAAVPVLAAVGGMLAPALIYALITRGDAAVAAGWAIPTATDIAFALAVLAVVGRNLPTELRTFLLALAVVDDLLAIVVIAVFFARDLRAGFLLGALVAIAVFAIVLRRYRRWRSVRFVLLAATALVAWALMLKSGVHATIAGVLMGFTVPVARPERRISQQTDECDDPSGALAAVKQRSRRSMARHIDDILRPISAGFFVPLFAFFAAGVTVGGLSGLVSSWGQRVTIAVIAGLVLGKLLGIGVTAVVVGRLVRSPLMGALAITDWIGVALAGGVGFTVSLLIGHLAFVDDPVRIADVQIGVVTGSVIAALAAAAVLGSRNRHYAARLAAAPQRPRTSLPDVP